MPLPTSLSLLPFFLPFLSVPMVPPDSARSVVQAVEARSVGQAVEDRSPASAAAPRRRANRRPPSGCEAPALPAYESIAFGSVNDGRLSRGNFVAESDTIRHVDAWDCNYWGTSELTGAIERVAASIAAERPGARLTIGELSKRRGGDIEGHSSHENGLDVDLGFYWLDSDGRPYEPRRFVDVRRDKTAEVDGRVLTFDTARNWQVIEGFLTDPEADLNIVIIDERIRSWLLAYARANGVDRELRRRAARVLRIPSRRAHPHRNHFHLRIYCPESANSCEDKNELHRWVAQARAADAERTVASR